MDKYTIAPPAGSTQNSVGAEDRPWHEGHFDRVKLNGGDLGEYLAESTGYGIVSGCEPSISGLTVTVGAGIVHLADGTRKEISASNITLDSADPSNPRIDLVYIDSTGTVAKVTGTAAASPSAPVLPTGGISVCNVTIAAGATTGIIHSNMNRICKNVLENDNTDIFYKGVAVLVPPTVTMNLSYQEAIDDIVDIKGNTVEVAPHLWASNSASAITGYKGDITVNTILSVCQYAKNKGLFVIMKPHVTGSGFVYYSDINPADPEAFINSYITYCKQIINACGNYIDVLSVTNEMDNQTKIYRSLWVDYIDYVKANYPKIKMTNASRTADLKTNVFLDKLDILGVNLYLPITGNLETKISVQKRSLFDTNGLNIVTETMEKYNLPILVTEVGILPSEANFSDPGSWTQQGPVNYDARRRYLEVTANEYLKAGWSTIIWNQQLLEQTSEKRFLTEMFEGVQ